MKKIQSLVLPELLSSEQVADLLSISVRTVWRMVLRGELPKPIRYNRRLVRWRINGILDCLEKLAGES